MIQSTLNTVAMKVGTRTFSAPAWDAITSVSHNATTRIMRVVFTNGEVNLYRDVPAADYDKALVGYSYGMSADTFLDTTCKYAQVHDL